MRGEQEDDEKLSQKFRTLEIPVLLVRALAGKPLARAAFDRLPPSHQREYVNWIQEAAQEAARAERVDETIRRLLQGRGPGEK